MICFLLPLRVLYYDIYDLAHGSFTSFYYSVGVGWYYIHDFYIP